MATIGSIVTTGKRGAQATITGTGFGAAQGGSTLVFWPVGGASVEVTPTSWNATTIVADIPTDGTNDDLGKAAFFTVSVEGDPITARSLTFVLVQEDLPAPSTYVPGTYVFAPGGAEEAIPGDIHIAASLSGTANLTATASVPGVFSLKSVRFTGDPAYVDTNLTTQFSPERTTAFSVSLWVFVNPTATDMVLFSKKAPAGNRQGFEGKITAAGTFMFSLIGVVGEVSQSAVVFTAAPGFDDGSWHHVVFSNTGAGDASGLGISVDGTALAVTIWNDTLGTNTIVNTAHMTLGMGDTSFLTGYMDDVSLHTKSLSVPEVTGIYNAGMPRDLAGDAGTLSMVDWWWMGDSDTYPTIIDHGSNASNATMMNMIAGDIVTFAPDPVMKYVLATLSGDAALSGNLQSVLSDTYSTDFDGIDDYVDMGDVYAWEYTEQFSISLWVKPLANTSGMLIDKAEMSGEALGYYLRTFSGVSGPGLEFQVSHNLTVGANFVRFQVNAEMALNVWHHIVACWDGTGLLTGMTLWLDGVKLSPDALLGAGVTASIVTHLQPFTIAWSSGMACRIDEVSMFSADLDFQPWWIPELYNNGTPTSPLGHSTGACVSWWRMGDGDTYPTITDHGSGGYDGTMMNMTAGDFVADVPSGPPFDVYAVSLNGTTDYVTMGNNVAYERTAYFTIALWFKADAGSTTGTTRYLVAKTDTSGDHGYSLSARDNGLTFKLANVSPTDLISVSTDPGIFTDGEWHHVVVSSGGGTVSNITIYVDGVNRSLTTNYNNLTSSILSTNSFQVGAANGSNFWKGMIDDISIYDADLYNYVWPPGSADEALYNAGKSIDPRTISLAPYLAHLWLLGDGGDSGVTTLDQIGSADGTLTGGGAAFVADVP